MKKLKLYKTTIANLNNDQLNSVKGGLAVASKNRWCKDNGHYTEPCTVRYCGGGGSDETYSAPDCNETQPCDSEPCVTRVGPACSV